MTCRKTSNAVHMIHVYFTNIPIIEHIVKVLACLGKVTMAYHIAIPLLYTDCKIDEEEIYLPL
jgi:hypothetical protein